MEQAIPSGAGRPPSTAPQENEVGHDDDKDKVLPLPGWLVKVYFIFPVFLYIPDAIFNYYVYSDGGTTHNANPVLQAGFVALWGFLAIGVVGMAYLLSVMAPWHWGQGHRIQAFFCAMGVVIATAITTWCSLAFRSQGFISFPTDKWVYNVWPQLQESRFSLTMLLVAIAPPFWGLFWAMVQPTTRRRSLAQMQMSHEERVLRTQQEAELKQIKAETNAKVREAQLRGMAATAAAARKQAVQLVTRKESQETQETQEAPVNEPVNEPVQEPSQPQQLVQVTEEPPVEHEATVSLPTQQTQTNVEPARPVPGKAPRFRGLTSRSGRENDGTENDAQTSLRLAMARLGDEK